MAQQLEEAAAMDLPEGEGDDDFWAVSSIVQLPDINVYWLIN